MARIRKAVSHRKVYIVLTVGRKKEDASCKGNNLKTRPYQKVCAAVSPCTKFSTIFLLLNKKSSLLHEARSSGPQTGILMFMAGYSFGRLVNRDEIFFFKSKKYICLSFGSHQKGTHRVGLGHPLAFLQAISL